MLPTLSIGPVSFPTAGLVLIFGAWACLSLVEYAAKRLHLDASATYALAVVGLVSAFVGARLAFVFTYWPAYQNNLLGIIWPLNNGYAPWGGLLLGAAGLFFYGRYRQLPFAATLDALVPGFILGLIFISLADFLGGPGFGTLTAVPWGISQYGVRRHPVQLYEILVGLTALIVWWRLVDKRAYPGQLTLIATAVYSAGRLFVEAFRDNGWLTTNGYHIIQLISLALLLVSLFLLGWLSSRNP